MHKRPHVFLLFSLFSVLLCMSLLINKEANEVRAHKEAVTERILTLESQPEYPTLLKDRHGTVFSEEYTEFRSPLGLADIPSFLQELFILSEDKDFYDHIGFDVSGIARAVLANAESGELSEGASTITQQVVRMRYLTAEKNYERKAVELFLSKELEDNYSKEEIFEMYLNEMYFANGVYGIGAASLFYFDRPLSEVNEAEMAFLAAIPNNPSLYDPLVHFDRTKERQERLLKGMKLKPDYEELLLSVPIHLTTKKKKNEFPDYSTFVLNELQSLISEKEGYTERLSYAKSREEKDEIRQKLTERTHSLIRSGIIIETALDGKVQGQNVKSINNQLGPLSVQGAAVVIDNKDREVISVSGGVNYKKHDFNRSYQAVRPPASTFKPLLVYAPLFEETNMTPSSKVDAGRYCIDGFCPENYSGKWYGDVPINTAFRQSYNTPALRLLETVGIDVAFSYLEPFEFHFLTDQDRNYTAALGGLSNGVTPYELAGAYASFIDGTYVQPRSIQRVTTKEGKVLYEWEHTKQQVWTPETVQHIRGLLQETVDSGTATAVSPASGYTGAKTGTTNNYQDFWIAGLNSHYTIAVWIGYDTPSSMEKLRSLSAHQKIFSDLINLSP